MEEVNQLAGLVPKGMIASELRNAVRHLLAARRELKKGAFTDEDETAWELKKKTGWYASMQGLRAIAGALIALPDGETAGLVRPDLKPLPDDWLSVTIYAGKTEARDASVGTSRTTRVSPRLPDGGWSWRDPSPSRSRRVVASADVR